MERTWLQPRQLHLAQPDAHSVLMHVDRKPARNLIAQVHTAPADYPITLRVRPHNRER